ncbi:protein CDC27Hs [Renibacterium salmoninarum ATCC 33209]|uniref:Protein CDC27Hs n=1 Tax=Renibacterium salmoninarum (strain ATCC 33209 / DSM 20767 / JCM 11484 / NBRC 15589 / NCIMB 2235) TaxID=288705 RepID=A9WLU8_RENSM|nr:protein CDC27Hs [Renibacterium salmoninarum ATCC 33209]
MLAASRPEEAFAALEALAKFSAGARGGRVEFLRVQALAALGRTVEAAEALKAGITVPDLHEGENSLAALWQQVCPGADIPAAYQFGMSD